MASYKNIKGITIEIGGDSAPLSKALGDIDSKARDLQKELKQVNKDLKFDTSNITLLKQKQDVLNETISKTKERLKVLQEAEAQCTEEFKKEHADEYRALQREIIETEQNLKNLEKQQRDFGSVNAQILADAGAKMQEFGSKVEDVGKKFLPLTGVIAGSGVAAIKFGSDLEDSLAKASTLIDTTEYSMDELRAGILQVSNDTGVSADQLADSMYNALSASVELGEDGTDMMEFLYDAAILAKVGFTDIDTAVTATAKTLNAYGLGVEDTARIHNVLLNTQNMGITTVDELGEHLAKVTPTAAAFNVSFEQIGASLAVMTAQGTPASQATTQLNALLTELGKEGTVASKNLRELTGDLKDGGMSFTEMMDAGYDLNDVLSLFQINADTTDQSLIDLFGSVQAGKSALSITNGEFSAAMEQMSASGDLLGESYAKLETSSHKTGLTLNRLKNVVIDLGGTLLDALQPALDKISNAVEKFTNWFSNLNDTQKKGIIITAGVVAAIGPLLIAIGKISTGIGGLLKLAPKVVSGITSIGGGFKKLFSIVLAHPFIAIGVAIIAGLVILWNNCEEFRNFVIELITKIKDALEIFINFFKNLFCGEVEGNLVYLQNIINIFKEHIENIFKLIKGVFSGFIDFFKGIFTEDWELAFSGLQNIGTAFGEFFNTFFTETIPGIFQNLSDWMHNIFSIDWSERFGFFGDILNIFGTVVTTVIDFVKDLFDGLITFLKGIFTGDWEMAFEGIQQIVSAFGEFLLNIITEVIPSIFNTLMDWIRNIFSNDWSERFGFFGEILNGFSANVRNIIDGIQQIFNGFISFIKSVFAGDWEGAWNAIKDIFGGIFDSLVGLVKAPLNAIIGLLNGCTGAINVMIGGLNKIQFDVPNWVPFMGGKTFGFNIPEIGSIPYLAKGGVVSSGAAVVGEAGAELLQMINGKAVVTPLTKGYKDKAYQAVDGGEKENYVINQDNKFYSPKPLTPAETARRQRLATQQAVMAIRKG